MLIASQVLKGVYAIAIAAVLIVALKPQSQPASAPVTTAPRQPVVQPSPVQPVQPSPFSSPVPVVTPGSLPEIYDPQLRSWVEAVQTWDAATIDQWRQHCAYFSGGQGLPEPDNQICKAIHLRQ
jgi:hypothetical protein